MEHEKDLAVCSNITKRRLEELRRSNLPNTALWTLLTNEGENNKPRFVSGRPKAVQSYLTGSRLAKYMDIVRLKKECLRN